MNSYRKSHSHCYLIALNQSEVFEGRSMEHKDE